MRNVGPINGGGSSDPTLAGDVTGLGSANSLAKISGNAIGSAGALAALGADASGAASAAQAAAIALSNQRASNLSDVANAATARTNLGLGTAATQASGAFDAAGAATAAQAASQPLDADLTTLAGSAAAAQLAVIGTTRNALATSGAVTWNPNTSPMAIIIISGNVTSITMTAPTWDSTVPVCLMMFGAGIFSWPSSIGNADLIGGTFAAPVAGQLNILTFMGVNTNLGSGSKWRQICAQAVNVS